MPEAGCIFDNAIFDPEIFNVCPEEVPAEEQPPAGGDGFRRKRRKVPENRQWEDQEARELRLKRELEDIYDELHGLKPAELAEAKQIVAPFTESKAKSLPPADRIDFAAMARSLEHAERLLALYERTIEDEEDAFMMLMAA